jgi:hypothetical protein
MIKKGIILLVSILIQNSFCYSQNSNTYDTISFYDLKFNGSNLHTNLKNIKKYIDDTKTKARVFPGEYANVPFSKFNKTDNIYTIYSEFLDFSYKENSNLIYIRRIKVTDKIKVSIKNIKLTKNTKIEDLEKNFPNTSVSDKDEYQFKILIVKENEKGFLSFNFKNGKLSDVMLENYQED